MSDAEELYIAILREWEGRVADPVIYEHLDILFPAFAFRRVVFEMAKRSCCFSDVSCHKTRTKIVKKILCCSANLTYLYIKSTKGFFFNIFCCTFARKIRKRRT